MTLRLLNPVSVLETANRELNDVFDSLFGGTMGAVEESATCDWLPRADIAELKDGYELYVDLPGMKKEDIKIVVKDNRLNIKGERKIENRDKLLRSEIYSGSFSRSFVMGEDIDPGKVQANFEDGVLTVKLAKKEVKEPQEVNIAVK